MEIEYAKGKFEIPETTVSRLRAEFIEKVDAFIKSDWNTMIITFETPSECASRENTCRSHYNKKDFNLRFSHRDRTLYIMKGVSDV